MSWKDHLFCKHCHFPAVVCYRLTEVTTLPFSNICDVCHHKALRIHQEYYTVLVQNHYTFLKLKVIITSKTSDKMLQWSFIMFLFGWLTVMALIHEMSSHTRKTAPWHNVTVCTDQIARLETGCAFKIRPECHLMWDFTQPSWNQWDSGIKKNSKMRMKNFQFDLSHST